MIILDTNVVSEVLCPIPDLRVAVWFEQTTEKHVITAVTAAELLQGVALLPEGRRRLDLSSKVEYLLGTCEAEILDFTLPAARQYAFVRSGRTRMGRPISVADAMIAAICRANGASLATRNVKDFEGLGLTLVNPWEDPPVAAPSTGRGGRRGRTGG